jgi:hypothetical protein
MNTKPRGRKSKTVYWSYAGESRSAVVVKDPHGVPATFVLSRESFEDLIGRNPDLTFKFNRNRNGLSRTFPLPVRN